MNRRTIRELSVKYNLEPELRDVYVEGKADRDFFKWFLERSGLSEVKVFSIDSIDIPSSLLSSLELTEGNKQRVIALAIELNGSVGDTGLQGTCIVDTDEDRILTRVLEMPHLLWTDFASLEAYLFDEVHMRKFMTMVLGCEFGNIADLLNHYGIVLRELFLIRAAARDLGLALRWLEFKDCCMRGAQHLVEFDRQRFLIKLLDASNMRDSITEMIERIEQLRGKLGDDIRNCVNGHDLTELLHWERREQARQKELRNVDAVRSALVGCFEYNTLLGYPMFQRLLARVAP